MKHPHLLFLLLALTTGSTCSFAQSLWQLPNPGFEQWDGGKESEPTHWNTFESSDGSYASLASDNHHYRRAGHRTGGSGSYYLTIYTKSILGIKANGNMTTGRIHAGAMSANSSNNYNYTQRSNNDHNQSFSATPDSMYVWVSFYAGSANSTAQVEAIIHGDNDFKAPNEVGDVSKYAGRAVAQTTRTTQSASQMNWIQLRVPFVYDGNSQPAYILVNMTTNMTPGGGDKNDSLSIDDIEFIYSAWLTDLQVEGTPLAGFDKSRFNYTVHVDNLSAIDASSIICTTEAEDATVNKSLTAINDTALLATINITAEDGTTTKTYTITLTSGTVVAIGENHRIQQTELKLFPNPAHDIVTVCAKGTLELVDMQGQVVLRHNCNGTELIAIDHLPHGLYTAILNGSSTSKLVIK